MERGGVETDTGKAGPADSPVQTPQIIRRRIVATGRVGAPSASGKTSQRPRVRKSPTRRPRHPPDRDRVAVVVRDPEPK